MDVRGTHPGYYVWNSFQLYNPTIPRKNLPRGKEKQYSLEMQTLLCSRTQRKNKAMENLANLEFSRPTPPFLLCLAPKTRLLGISGTTPFMHV